MTTSSTVKTAVSGLICAAALSACGGGSGSVAVAPLPDQVVAIRFAAPSALRPSSAAPN